MSQIAKLCYDTNIPMIPFGTGTGLEGGVNAINVKTVTDKNLMYSFAFLLKGWSLFRFDTNESDIRSEFR